MLTHAHLDHCGRLPLLTREGFRGPIHATPASADFAMLVLEDAARIQVADVERQNRRLERQGRPLVEPLYLPRDVEVVEGRFQPLRYGESREIAKGINLRFSDAGHILGSASVELAVDDGGRQRTLIFSGDLGPKGVPMLCDPVPPEPASAPDLVVMESTYGDHDHRPMDGTLEEFRQILADAIRAQEKVLIPAFAIGRTQQILYHMAEFIRRGELPKFPIYLDSPMAIKAMALYRTHRDLFDEEATGLVKEHRFEKDLSQLHYTETAEESRAINNLRGMAVIIAGSGMCEGGRIVHHLKHNLWKSNVHVVIVGYQSAGSLGGQLVHGAERGQDPWRGGESRGQDSHARRVLRACRSKRACRLGRDLPERDEPSPAGLDARRGEAARGAASTAQVDTLESRPNFPSGETRSRWNDRPGQHRSRTSFPTLSTPG